TCGQLAQLRDRSRRRPWVGIVALRQSFAGQTDRRTIERRLAATVLVARGRDRARSADRHSGCVCALGAVALRTPCLKEVGMAKLVFGMNQSLDGYVDHMAMGPPSPALFRQFIEDARAQEGSVYGRQVYELMRYWEDDHPDWDAERQAFAAAWR